MAAVICLTDRRRSDIATLLCREGYHVYSTYTADHAVCLCVQHYVSAVILDQELFVETNGWSIAQSIKGVRPSVCVILMSDARVLGSELPKGVDFVVAKDDHAALVRAIEIARSGFSIRPGTSTNTETIQ